MANILLLNGANLNLLGIREPDLYGKQTLGDLCKALEHTGAQLGHRVSHYQSNAEHELIDKIHAARTEDMDFIILNPGAYTHTSIALRDALLGVGIAFIEVHLSNIYAREAFRRRSYFSDIACGVISGLGAKGYELALLAADQILKTGIPRIHRST